MEQGETDKPPADATHRAGLAGSIAGAIGWFGGSLGAIGVMLYACGYLISIAQLHLLGIGRLVSYSHDYYVQTGGSFVADLGSTLGTGAAFIGKELVAFVVLVVGATVILYRTKLRRLAWVVRLRGWWQRAAVVWQPAHDLANFCSSQCEFFVSTCFPWARRLFAPRATGVYAAESNPNLPYSFDRLRNRIWRRVPSK